MKLVLALLVSLLVTPLCAQQPPPPAVAAKAYLLVDFQSGQTLAGQNADDRVEPASLTKLMTAYLTFGALRDKKLTLKQTVPVSEHAWRAEGSRMFIEPKTPVTVEELIRGMIIQSGNDASIALAEAIAGSEDVFAQWMTREAERLGMKNTSFMNSTGLPHAKHYSTARDLIVLASSIIREFPEHYALYSQKEYRYNGITQANRNRLLWIDPTVDGVKTGLTESAGYCLVSSARRNDRRLVSVVLGTASNAARTSESQKLLHYGFQFFDTVKLYQKGQSVSTLPVWKGTASTVGAGFTADFHVTLPKGQAEKLKATLETQQPLMAPVGAGQKIGTMKLSVDGKAIGETPVVAMEAVGLGNIFARGWDTIRLLFK